MAPTKKRKAAASEPTTTPKKVRIGDISDIPDVELSSTGRPKRASIGEPQYKDRRTNNTLKEVSLPQVLKVEGEVKRRGRPPKNSTTPVPAITATEDEPEPVVRKRGRPPKNATEPTATKKEANSLKSALKNGAKASPAVQVSARSARSAIPQNEDAKPAPAKRGRKPKATTVTTAPAKRGRKPKTTTATTAPRASTPISESEDDLNGDTTAGSLAMDTNPKTEDMEAVDQDIQYWLMKAEPQSRIEKGVDVKFSIDDLAAKVEPEGWDGVRNPAARNNMRAMRKGDLAFFYHSNCPNPGIAGVMRIVAEHSTDESALDPGHPYYDPKSDPQKPKWELVHVEFVKKFDKFVSLKELKSFSQHGGALENMQMLKQGRLSVSAVSADEWRFILAVAGEPASLGDITAKDGYESDIDGEGEETAAEGDAGFASERNYEDLVNGAADNEGGIETGAKGALSPPISDDMDDATDEEVGLAVVAAAATTTTTKTGVIANGAYDDNSFGAVSADHGF
ncbi:hypothetical protein H2202_000858 [Exophiala xenobiotica]|nr:hypothetical protein H2202_000858 [Exophiala xenobiotica]KAK5195283.1 hypothetical protein LTR92_005413 [Exophiala xenobiotica]KAK5209862.1 hypothetical protein LTR41_004494 [Exophiala xenobiotica]KAK5225737.1 hypothetical protein LTR72_003640 [Exophiala xenobiotica]KAK5236028.1 hypothetical protein LTR47_002754 [Exophiala xenobiotica]